MTLQTNARQTILVVDDNLQNRLVVEGHLSAAGYEVLQAESGARAIEMVQEKAPDLVLLDVLMPGMDGFETCRQIKALPRGGDMPVVFLTALLDLGSHRKALDSGADDFLTKPVNRTELLIRVRSLLWIRRLRDELAEGYHLIRSQRDALVHAQRQKEELSTLIVHDLKGPLTAIYALLGLALRDPALAPETRDSLGEAANASLALHRMILNLLDISRSEDGRLVPRCEEVELAGVVTQVATLFSRSAEAAGQKIVTELRSPGRVFADRDLILRLVENLVENALKYSPANSAIKIEVLAPEDGAVRLSVRDQGRGIPDVHRESIFEKYFQIEPNSVPPLRASRGLGLAFCRLAAEAHGGRIWVEANEPAGSLFFVQLPAL
ncbi:MAG TPA: hybrid sensor histidine kinase/response regulator [Polyangiaceae bacterium]|jgi:signal transduction histidine kinase|nr:hybrid sensor histidine kinase/response regulator [Polyangiaceae bacterium]